MDRKTRAHTPTRATRRTTRLLVTAALVTTLATGAVASFALTHQAAASPTITFATTPATYATGTGPSDVVTGDLGNGAQDIVEASSATDHNPITVLWNNGKGTFTTITPTLTGAKASAVAIGDFNGDGTPDLVVAEVNNSRVQILTGDGTGAFTAGATVTVDGAPTAVATGDFNGDGFSDIAVVYSTGTGGGLDVLINNKSGSFSKTQLSFGPASGGPNYLNSAQAVAVGNLNGHQGIVTADTNGCVSVFLGNGDGTLQAEQVYTTTTVGDLVGAVALAHLNGSNNLLDIVSSDVADGTVNVLYNQGNGTYHTSLTSGDTYQVGSSDESSIYLSVADLNGDGYADLAVTDGTSGVLKVLPGVLETSSGTSSLGTGNTVFDGADAVTVYDNFDNSGAAPGAAPGALTAADLTGNGLNDLVVLDGNPANQVDVFTNTSPAPTPGPKVTSAVSGGQTIDGTTYVTPSSIITFTANSASAISYRYFETSLGTPIGSVGTSRLLAMRLGGAAESIPHNLGNFFLPYKTVSCTTTATCSTTTTITGTTSGTVSIAGPTLAATTLNRIGAESRHVAGKTDASISASVLVNQVPMISGTPYTIQFYATGTNGNGSPATAQTIHVVLVTSLTGLSGAGTTSHPITAQGAQQPATQASASTGNTKSSGATSDNGNATSQHGQQTQQSQQQATPAATTTSLPRLALMLAVLVALVLFALGGSLALAFSRRRKQ